MGTTSVSATGRIISTTFKCAARFAGVSACAYTSSAYVGNDPVDGIDPFGLKCIRKMILVTAYSDSGPGKDWPYFAPKKRGGKPGSVGPGTVAVANTNPPPYPFGSGVSVSNNPDPFGADNPLAGPAYGGGVHDTGAGWDPNHNNVSPGDWIDIWLPHKQAIKWGKQWRWVTICTPDDGCSSGSSTPFKLGDYGIDNPYRNLPSAPFSF